MVLPARQLVDVTRLLERLGHRAVRAIAWLNGWVTSRWNDDDPPDPRRN